MFPFELPIDHPLSMFAGGQGKIKMPTPVTLFALIRQDGENHSLRSQCQEPLVFRFRRQFWRIPSPAGYFGGIANLAQHGLLAGRDWLAAGRVPRGRSLQAKESASNRPPKRTADDSYDTMRRSFLLLPHRHQQGGNNDQLSRSSHR